MMIPTVHLNGTSKGELLNQLMDAANAVSDAIRALQISAPNGRDYYPQGSGAINSATAEHFARVSKLIEVHTELHAIAEAIPM